MLLRLTEFRDAQNVSARFEYTTLVFYAQDAIKAVPVLGRMESTAERWQTYSEQLTGSKSFAARQHYSITERRAVVYGRRAICFRDVGFCR